MMFNNDNLYIIFGFIIGYLFSLLTILVNDAIEYIKSKKK